ncbi:MAG: hypothetical protein IJZ55_00650 [Lachnospiraceae bacterium]|nr:hypothetical protein [Lachnospiraceae bacterium]
MLRKLWNTLRHGDAKTKGFLISVAVLALVTLALFGAALVLQLPLPGLLAVATTIITAAMAKNAVLVVKKDETIGRNRGKEGRSFSGRSEKLSRTAAKDVADSGENREEPGEKWVNEIRPEELEEFEELGKKKKKTKKKAEKEKAEQLQREREDEEDFGDNALVAMTEEKLKRLLVRYKVKQEHVPVIIDLCIPERVRQAPGFAWTEDGKLKILLIEHKTRMIERPLSALQVMEVERGIAVKASNEYTELRDTDLMKKVFTPYLPRYQKKEISGRTVLLKNLYVLDEVIKFTSASVNELRKLFPFRIEISDRRLQGENISPYYKDVFTNTFLWKDGILTLNEYKEEVEYILTSMASPNVPYGEFETTLSAIITSGLLPMEYRDFAYKKREELEKTEVEKRGRKNRK